MSRERCKDLVGKRVVLKHAITTKGGDEFMAGVVFEVAATWRGRFHLRGPKADGHDWRNIRMVRRASFVIVG